MPTLSDTVFLTNGFHSCMGTIHRRELPCSGILISFAFAVVLECSPHVRVVIAERLTVLTTLLDRHI